MILNPLVYALLAERAYTAVPDIGDPDSAARAVTVTTQDGLAIAFPGTDNLACWLADLDCGVIQTDLGKLHKGFRLAAGLILAAVLNTARNSPAPVILAGHSEGGALALILAGLLCLSKVPPLAVFAFEPPRVSADDKLGDVLRANDVHCLLTANGNDIVPLIPRVLFPWRHPAELTVIGKPPLLPVPNVEEHAMARVIASLRALAEVVPA